MSECFPNRRFGMKVWGTFKRENRRAGGRAFQKLFKEYSAQLMSPSEGRDDGPVDLQMSKPLSGWDRRNQMLVTSMEEMVSADSCLSCISSLVRGRHKVETEYRLAAICYNLTRVVSLIGEGLKKWLLKLRKGLFPSILGLPGTMKRHITNYIDSLMEQACCRTHNCSSQELLLGVIASTPVSDN